MILSVAVAVAVAVALGFGFDFAVPGCLGGWWHWHWHWHWHLPSRGCCLARGKRPDRPARLGFRLVRLGGCSGLVRGISWLLLLLLLLLLPLVLM